MTQKKFFATALAMMAMLAGSSRAEEQDSASITKLLSDAKAEALTLNNDAKELKSYTMSKMSWQSHAGKLDDMKQHVNKASGIVQEMNNVKSTGSRWQQTAVDRITPALNELATNIQATIEHLNQNQSHVNMPPYRDYAAANADLADDLAQVVSDFVNYAQAKSTFEKDSRKLELDSGR